MGIRFTCPSGHKLHVKEFLAGKRGICPHCGAKFVIPAAPPSSGPVMPPTPGPNMTVPRVADSATVRPQSYQADAASPSVIIAVTESSIVPAAPPPNRPVPVGTDPATPAPEQASPVVVPEIVNEPANGLPSIVIPEVVRPTPPEKHYLSRQERRRRTQFKVAIALLLAVIVLAGVLVWILLKGPIRPVEQAADKSTPAAMAQRGLSP